MSEKRILPHVRQRPNSQYCGAACLEMLLRYYGVAATQEAIAEEVLGLEKKDCRTFLMVAYGLRQEVPMMAISVRNKSIPQMEGYIDSLLNGGYDITALFYPDYQPNASIKNAVTGHWVVVSYLQNGMIYLNDPLKSETKTRKHPLRFSYFAQRMNAQLADVEPNILIVSCSPRSNKRIGITQCLGCKKSFPIFTEPFFHSSAILCPYCDRFQSFPQTVG